MTDNDVVFDVAIVGGGAAGLSAALVLGRQQRHVLLLDSGDPRNAASPAIHMVLTRDGISPDEFFRLGDPQSSPTPQQPAPAQNPHASRAPRLPWKKRPTVSSALCPFRTAAMTGYDACALAAADPGSLAVPRGPPYTPDRSR